MNRVMNIISKAGLLVAIGMVCTAGVSFCPWDIRDEGACGSWRLYQPAGYSALGECVHNVRCKSNLSGNGAFLSCTENNVDCTASLQIYGPPEGTIYQGTTTVACNMPNATRVATLIVCLRR